MAPPTDDVDGSLSCTEKEELLKKIKFWEDKYEDLSGNYNKLSDKFEEVAKNNSNNPSPQDPLTELSTMKKQISNALRDFKILAEEVRSNSSSKNKERIEEIDQYLHKNSLFHKMIPPSNSYGIDFIKWIVNEINKLFPGLEIPVQLCHIDAAHPLKTKRNTHSVVIVKFTCRWMKDEVYKRRSHLKDTSHNDISITEHLTSSTKELLETTRSIVGKDTKVFTNNCVINLKFNNRKFFVKTYKDIQYLAKNIGYKLPLPPPGLQVPNPQAIGANSQQIYARDPNVNGPFAMINTTAPYNMHQTSNPYPYYQNYMHPQGKPSNIGRGNNSVWNNY